MNSKRYLLIILLFCPMLLNTSLGQEWTKIIPSFHPDGDYILYYGTFTDSINGWFVDNNSGRTFHTTNKGFDWEMQRDSVKSSRDYKWDICFTDSLHGWVLASNTDSSYLLQTTNSGVTWNKIASPFFIKICFLDNMYGVGAGPAGIFYSKNGGQSWEISSYPEIENGILNVFKILFVNGKNGWILLQPGISFEGDENLFMTKDSGLSWTKASNDPPARSTDIYALDSLRLFVCGPSSPLVFSEDGGNNWENKNTNGPASIYYLTECNGWGVGGWAGISETNDCSNTWQKIETDVHQLAHINYNRSSKSIFVLGFDKIIYLNEITTKVKLYSNSILPSEFNLHQNYPNPFNPSTIISFDIYRTGLYSLSLYDLVGRQIISFFHKSLYPGSYKVSLSSTNLSSGIYFCRLQSSSHSQLIKLILLQ